MSKQETIFDEAWVEDYKRRNPQLYPNQTPEQLATVRRAMSKSERVKPIARVSAPERTEQAPKKSKLERERLAILAIKQSGVYADRLTQDLRRIEAIQPKVTPLPIVTTFDSLPPSELYPNVTMSQHWRVRQKAAKIARADGEAAGYTHKIFSGKGEEWQTIQRYSIEIQCTVPDRHLRDLLGAAGACKAWIDGLVDSGLIADDNDKNLVEAKVIAPVYEKGKSETRIIIREVK